MARYIDAERLIGVLNGYAQFYHVEMMSFGVFIDAVVDMPTADVVEVVRCCDAEKGDCMFNHWHETPHGKKYHICNLNQLAYSEHDDFYCAYGERREDDKG